MEEIKKRREEQRNKRNSIIILTLSAMGFFAGIAVMAKMQADKKSNSAEDSNSSYALYPIFYIMVGGAGMVCGLILSGAVVGVAHGVDRICDCFSEHRNTPPQQAAPENYIELT